MSSKLNATITEYLDKLDNPDPDLRFMSLNDLTVTAESEAFNGLDGSFELKIVNAVIEHIKDTNTEVRNQSVRCIGALAKRTRDSNTQAAVDRLLEGVGSKDPLLRDVAALALKSVVSEVAPDSTIAPQICSKLIPKLLAQLSVTDTSQDVLLDSMDIVADVFFRFTGHVTKNKTVQATALNVLADKMLAHSRPAVRKRALSPLGALAACSTSDIFTQLAKKISTDLQSKSTDRIRSVVQLVGTLARTCPARLGRRLPDFMPRIMEQTQQDDDDLREICLQTLELILLKCPTEASEHVNAAVEIGLVLIKHDPNFAEIDDDEEMADADEDEDDEEEELIDDDYSDDEDLSWKVRRSAAKLLNAAIVTRPELLAAFASTVAPVLVQRFSEREENVRSEVFSNFIALLKQMQIYTSASSTNETVLSAGALKRKRADADELTGPHAQLTKLVPSICKVLNKELTAKSIPTRFAAVAVLRELVAVLHGGLEGHIAPLIGQLSRALQGADQRSGSSLSLKAEALSLLSLVFLLHTPRWYEDQLTQLVQILVGALQDKLHRNTLEALAASAQLITSIRPLPGSGGSPARSGAGYSEAAIAILAATMDRLQRTDSDQEIKERGIACLGVLISHAGDDISSQLDDCLTLLHDRLTSEITRLATVKVITQIVTSPLCEGAKYDKFAKDNILEIALILRQNNRSLRLAAFECLIAMLTSSTIKGNLEKQVAIKILTEVEPILKQEVDLNVYPLALQVVSAVLRSNADAIEIVQQTSLPKIFQSLPSPLMQGAAMDGVLDFFRTFVATNPGTATEIIASLMSTLEASKGSSTGTHIYSAVARSIGAVLVSAPQSAKEVVERAETSLKPSKADGTQESEQFFSLLVLGEIGRIQDLASRPGVMKAIQGFYKSPSEEVKTAAAFAIGNIAVGNLDHVLPVIERDIGSADDVQRVLSLRALKELITHGTPTQLATIAPRIWAPLFNACETKDEATRNVGAECVGRLTLTEPSRYLRELHSGLSAKSASTRCAVISAVRFTLTETSKTFDNLIGPTLVDFLSLIKDKDLDVRRHAVYALNSAAHNKPQLIRDHLDVLLPLLYAETVVHPELLRKVTMGPFTVTIDDGLDLRKNAFETMYTLLDTCLSKIRLPDFIARVIGGLRDDDGIKVLCYLTMMRLATLAPSQVSAHVEEVVPPVRDTLKLKLKETPTKQEVEREQELHRAIFRALVALHRLSSPTSTPAFVKLIEEIKAGERATVFSEVELSVRARDGVSSIGRTDLMDVDN